MEKPLGVPHGDSPLDVRIAVGQKELTSAFELVYSRYLANGYIEPHPGGIVYREVFGLPTSRTIIATTESGAVMGTLTVVGDNPTGIEMETTYPTEVQLLREEGRGLAEITCLAIQPTPGFHGTEVFFELTRFMIHYAYWREFHDLLMAVHPRHYRFYWRHFRAHPIGPCRPHQFVGGNLAIGCRIDLENLKRNVRPELWQRYFARQVPETDYMRPPIEPADHCCFLGRSGITPEADPTDHRRWNKDAA